MLPFQFSRWFSDDFRASHADLADAVAGVFLANNVACYQASCALLGNMDLRGAISSFRVPVSVIVGEQDYATPLAMAQTNAGPDTGIDAHRDPGRPPSHACRKPQADRGAAQRSPAANDQEDGKLKWAPPCAKGFGRAACRPFARGPLEADARHLIHMLLQRASRKAMGEMADGTAPLLGFRVWARRRPRVPTVVPRTRCRGSPVSLT